MLTLIIGNDRASLLARREKVAAALLKKNPSLVRKIFDADTARREEIEMLIAGADLFGEQSLVVLDRLIGESDMSENIIALAKSFKDSSNTFIIVEDSLPAADLKKISKYADEVIELESKKNPPAGGERFNTFALTDAVAARDKKLAWQIYRQAREAGIETREIGGVLFWGLKSLALAASEKDALSSGLNPFVYRKAKAALKNWKPGEPIAFANELITLTMNEIQGLAPLDLSLEKFILEKI